jgi:CheY-like chemotaxis protein
VLRCTARVRRRIRATTRAGQRNAEARLRVLIVDDDARIRRGLRELIDASDDVRVVGQTASRRSALTLDLELQPDTAVVDLLLPHAHDGLAVLEEPAARGRATIAISIRPDLAPLARTAGARIFLAKVPPLLGELLPAIREVTTLQVRPASGSGSGSGRRAQARRLWPYAGYGVLGHDDDVPGGRVVGAQSGQRLPAARSVNRNVNLVLPQAQGAREPGTVLRQGTTAHHGPGINRSDAMGARDLGCSRAQSR